MESDVEAVKDASVGQFFIVNIQRLTKRSFNKLFGKYVNYNLLLVFTSKLKFLPTVCLTLCLHLFGSLFRLINNLTHQYSHI